MFTAAQAAEKWHSFINKKRNQFTAAQAAEKIVRSSLESHSLFTAAQAAEKTAHSQPLPFAGVHCRTGS